MALQWQAVDVGAPDQRDATSYWKIGLGLPDVDAAVSNLWEAGVEVSTGAQFLDVGYLTHMSDPAGYCIELLQDTFQSNFIPAPPAIQPLACLHPKVGQVTLRVADINRSLEFYSSVLGMRLLCHYPVGNYGFSLYFLAFSDESPPEGDPAALSSREWTYSRPYTTLELQVRNATPSRGHPVPSRGSAGWQGLVIGVSSLEAARLALEAASVRVQEAADEAELVALDPDGYRIWLRAPS